ncbi:hypothetical protein COSO111634_13440 [Corallococcus soli]
MTDERGAVLLQVREGPEEDGHVPAPRGTQALAVLRHHRRGRTGREHHPQAPGHRVRFVLAQLRGGVGLRQRQALHHRPVRQLRPRGGQVVRRRVVDDLERTGRRLFRHEQPGERAVEEGQDARQRAVVVLEEAARPTLRFNLVRQHREHGHVRATELVDGLLAITHRAQERGLQRQRGHQVRARRQLARAALPSLRQQQHQLQLQPVGVLELVHQQRAQPLLNLLAELRMVAQQVARLHQQRREVEHVAPRQLRVVALLQLAQQVAEGLLEGGRAPRGVGILQPPHRAIALALHPPEQLLEARARALAQVRQVARLRQQRVPQRGEALRLEEGVRRHPLQRPLTHGQQGAPLALGVLGAGLRAQPATVLDEAFELHLVRRAVAHAGRRRLQALLAQRAVDVHQRGHEPVGEA